MTLRIMLLGLVASLGFELPSGNDLSCWAKAGQTWFQSRMIEPSGPETVEPSLDPAEPTDCQQVVETSELPSIVCPEEDESVFQALTESIAADFSADLLANHREETLADPVVVASVETEEEAPAVLNESDEAGCLVVTAEEASPVETVEEAPSRPDRVSNAVRLTREAVQAWADLMQEAVSQ